MGGGQLNSPFIVSRVFQKKTVDREDFFGYLAITNASPHPSSKKSELHNETFKQYSLSHKLEISTLHIDCLHLL